MNLTSRAKLIICRETMNIQGKNRLFGFFVGKTMAASNGRADPVVTSTVLKALIDS